jgi:RNA polymerase sigma-70 factor (ECF subfamily)
MLSPSPDATLVSRIRTGDDSAATELVRRYYDDCWRYAYRMTGHRADAEDVVQDTFLRALRALDRYQEQHRFRAWLFSILTNRCRTLLVRQRRAIRFVTADHLDHIPADGTADDPFETSDIPPAELADALQHALSHLGSRYREAFLLKHAEGMEYTQMAEITGATVSALKMRVKRARELLRPLLEDNLHD